MRHVLWWASHTHWQASAWEPSTSYMVPPRGVGVPLPRFHREARGWVARFVLWVLDVLP